MPDPTSNTHRTTPDAPPDGRSPVELLRWPAQDNRRRLLAALGQPRLLLLAPDTPPPTLIDDLELWIPDGSGTIASRRSLIGRVNQRLAQLGLDLQVIRRRGVLLTNRTVTNP